MYACAAKVLCAWRTWLKNGVELPVSRHGQSTRPHGARGIKTPPPPPPPHRSRSVSQDKCGRGRAAAEARLDEAMLQPGLSYCFCGPH
ncbi:unnamed protein product [Soboliphyme baturini]|uniref:Uncharacterized protein n=1 Tax=Soboliphyme baturini TaxID=241478 RepID=A0A183IEY8_9BILA|nr:unnamed protein product [Soboliphyme baturini]